MYTSYLEPDDWSSMQNDVGISAYGNSIPIHWQ